MLSKEDLHLYIIDSNNVNQSITCLGNKMKERTRRDKEIWFIDISAFQNIANASSMLDTLSLDIDDDMFLFMFIENDSATIWEMYKLAPEKDLIIKDFGSWTREIGLKLTNLEKWQRRGDLSVSISLKIEISKPKYLHIYILHSHLNLIKKLQFLAKLHENTLFNICTN